MKAIKKLLVLIIVCYTSTIVSAPTTSQKANQMIQSLKSQTAQLTTLFAQPIFSEIPTTDLPTLKNNIAKDVQNIRNDLKKIITLLQTLSTQQQEMLSQ